MWDSPWGKIGICICYDLSYRRVVDELVRQGAQALIVPTMDVAEWGARQHQLHARIAPLRAGEFAIPIFRVCSSGISQLIDAGGGLQASAPFPGEEATLSGKMWINGRARVPLDHWFGPAATGMTLGLGIWCVMVPFFRAARRRAAE